MARTNSRLAAGVGVVSVFLLLGGPGAEVAFADPGGDPGGSGGSDRGNSSERGAGSDRGNGGRDEPGGGGKGGDRGQATGRDGDGPLSAGASAVDEAPTGWSGGSPQTRVGSGREVTARPSPGGSDSVSDGASDSGSGGGSDSPPATSTSQPHVVTFGDSAMPAAGGDDPQPQWRAPSAPPPAAPPLPPPPPPPPPQAAPVPSLEERIVTPPAVVRQFVVAPATGLTDPLWAVAGLLLIPVAGAALGYRQARAAQSAERLHPS
ncbi:hypothetical protein [Mycobacterium sp. IDR2000157661]|uniref:hypothetical protein n=1 Tax=Mycobacterium sp. IDR2000157661 TaxID=2867005 RepID=UPI001EEA4651|nr:hypothetical protein [Mycobacterium sp. IDR2000157661]ULE33219.1 hypothetical protein K3G64_24790 [Mycobacterium sp. IDR2000157661]